MDEIVFWYLNGARGSGTVTVPSTAQAGEWKLTVLCNRSPDTRATVSLILEAGEEEESLTPVVTLEDCEQTYTAMPLSAPESKVTRPDGTALELDVTYVYYQDADCRMELSGAPTAVGICQRFHGGQRWSDGGGERPRPNKDFAGSAGDSPGGSNRFLYRKASDCG